MWQMAPPGNGRYGGGFARAREASSPHGTSPVSPAASTVRLTTVPLPQIWVTTTLMQPVSPAPLVANQHRQRSRQDPVMTTASGEGVLCRDYPVGYPLEHRSSSGAGFVL